MDHGDVLVVEGLYAEAAGSGPPVVLTHDGLLHSPSWDAQFTTFASDFRVVRWDRRGYGRSPRPAEQIGYWAERDPWFIDLPTRPHGNGCGRC